MRTEVIIRATRTQNVLGEKVCERRAGRPVRARVAHAGCLTCRAAALGSSRPSCRSASSSQRVPLSYTPRRCPPVTRPTSPALALAVVWRRGRVLSRRLLHHECR
eukprot:scaffold463_cov351-Prasinococcus_capsulatus_cf.AAC.7